MARLVVEAQGTAATGASQGAGGVDLATPGNSRRLPLVVSVADADGVSVAGVAVTHGGDHGQTVLAVLVD